VREPLLPDETAEAEPFFEVPLNEITVAAVVPKHRIDTVNV
jgi:hypothetical protein